MEKRKQISVEEAKRIGESLYVDWEQVNLEQFRQDLMGNPKQEARETESEQSYDSVLLSGKAILDHMHEIPDYLARLEKLKAEAEEYRARKK